MAFSAGLGDRGGLRSPREEPTFASLASPLRTVGTQLASSSASDARGQLHRRFTTNNIPTLSTPLSPIGQQRRQAAEPSEFTTTTAVRSSGVPRRRVWSSLMVALFASSLRLGTNLRECES